MNTQCSNEEPEKIRPAIHMRQSPGGDRPFTGRKEEKGGDILNRTAAANGVPGGGLGTRGKSVQALCNPGQRSGFQKSRRCWLVGVNRAKDYAARPHRAAPGCAVIIRTSAGARAIYVLFDTFAGSIEHGLQTGTQQCQASRRLSRWEAVEAMDTRIARPE